MIKRPVRRVAFFGAIIGLLFISLKTRMDVYKTISAIREFPLDTNHPEEKWKELRHWLLFYENENVFSIPSGDLVLTLWYDSYQAHKFFITRNDHTQLFLLCYFRDPKILNLNGHVLYDIKPKDVGLALKPSITAEEHALLTQARESIHDYIKLERSKENSSLIPDYPEGILSLIDSILEANRPGGAQEHGPGIPT